MGMKTKILASVFLLSIFLFLCVAIVTKWRHPHVAISNNMGAPCRQPRDSGTGLCNTDSSLDMIDNEPALMESHDFFVDESPNVPVPSSSTLPNTKESEPPKTSTQSSGTRRSSRYTYENRLFNRIPRLIEFGGDINQYATGDHLFDSLRRTIDNITSNTPSDMKIYQTFDLASDQILLIMHYMRYLRGLASRLSVVYDEHDLRPNRPHTLYSDTFDCFTGIKLTRYHVRYELNSDERRYFAYIEQFVEDTGNITIDNRSIMNVKDAYSINMGIKEHVVYVILQYIYSFYLESSRIASGNSSDYRSTELSRDNRAYYINQSIQPSHFNMAGNIVRPLICPDMSKPVPGYRKFLNAIMGWS